MVHHTTPHTHTLTQVSDQHMREFISLRESWILSRNPINLLAATSTQILTILTNSFVFLCVIYLARSIFLNFMLRMKLLSWFNRSIFTGLLVYLPLYYHFFLVLFLYFFAGSFASCAFFFIFVFDKYMGFCGIRSTNRIRWLSMNFHWTRFGLKLFFPFHSNRIGSIYGEWALFAIVFIIFLYFVLVFPFLICSNLSNQWI